MYDAVVIGGSFAGLSAAVNIARGRRTVCVIDARLPRNRFAASSHGFFTQDGANPLAMIAQARQQVAAYPTVTMIEGEAITARQDAPHQFTITLATGETVTAARVVIATGVIDHLPKIAGLAERWGKTAFSCPYCHGFEFSGQQLGVLNVVSASSHQAQLIPEWGPTTFFLNGQDTLDAATEAELVRRNVTIEPTAIAALEGIAPDLTGVRLVNDVVIPIHALFVAPESTDITPIAVQLGCELVGYPFGSLISVDDFKQTTVPGVFAAGDIVNPMANATLASASGVLAGVGLHRSLMFP